MEQIHLLILVNSSTSGVEMPLLQLGTAQLLTETGLELHQGSFVGMLPERTYRQVQVALENGLRAFDSAYIYRSQTAIGRVLGEWWRTGQLQSRQEVWITSKVFHPNAISMTFGVTHMPNMENMTSNEIAVLTLQHFEQSVMELGVGYVDLMLLHWPGSNSDGSNTTTNRQRRIAAWQILETAYKKGWARSIGVSNFSPTHLEQLKQDGATIVPVVNQIEASVTLQYADIVEYCKRNGIVPQAYSPFGRGLFALPDKLETIAAKYQKNVGQICIKYLLQLGYAVVYLSNSATRMVTNTEVFDFQLSDIEMELLNKLNKPDGGWGLPAPHVLP